MVIEGGEKILFSTIREKRSKTIGGRLRHSSFTVNVFEGLGGVNGRVTEETRRRKDTPIARPTCRRIARGSGQERRYGWTRAPPLVAERQNRCA